MQAKSMSFNVLFQQRLKQLVRESVKNQAQIARDVNISPSTLSKYLKASDSAHKSSGPSAYHALQLASYFNVSLAWLFGMTEVRIPFYQPGIQDIYNLLTATDQQSAQDFVYYLYFRNHRAGTQEITAAEVYHPHQSDNLKEML